MLLLLSIHSSESRLAAREGHYDYERDYGVNRSPRLPTIRHRSGQGKSAKYGKCDFRARFVGDRFPAKRGKKRGKVARVFGEIANRGELRALLAR
jgi:hypothetical protein